MITLKGVDPCMIANNLTPYEPTHPGEILKEEIEYRGISQRKLEELSGVKQPVIARMENGTNSPQLDTVLKVLAALGKTLYIGDLQKA